MLFETKSLKHYLYSLYYYQDSRTTLTYNINNMTKTTLLFRYGGIIIISYKGLVILTIKI